MTGYREFLAGKISMAGRTGFEVSALLPGHLKPHQDALSTWGCRKACCAILADTGLGKGRMALAWADAVHRHTGGNVLILTPLAVGPQLVSEAASIGLTATLCRDVSDQRPGINVTNYERLHKFDAASFAGVVLDESSCIKHHDSRTFAQLTEAFSATQFKLCETATPAPNDWTELGTHAEFLGICTRAEMLSEFFVHDGGETQVWRLKGHAREPFWRWVASWGAMIRSPADLGFDASEYKLPALTLHEHIVESGARFGGQLFAMEAATLSERRQARKASLAERVEACAAVVGAEPDENWIVWCDLNAEGDALAREIPGAVQVSGSQDIDTKEELLHAFQAGKITKLISKPSICGHGCNWQHAARMAFVGVTDSFEAYYQAVRRIWRFGQRRPVEVHVFASKAEGSVVVNLRRKEADAKIMSEQLAAYVGDAVRANVIGQSRYTNTYRANRTMSLPAWMESRHAM